MKSTHNEVAGRHRWEVGLTLFGVSLAILMSALESTVAGTAMPTVIATLGGIEIYSWVFAAYILASTIMTPIWGKMADLIGRRPAMFGGLACFILGSALSGAAQSMPQMILFRTIQGFGAAALFPVGMTMTAELLTLEQRAKVIGLFSSMWGVASLIGPIVGGYLTTYLSWRWAFYITLPFGIASGAMIWFAYHERQERRPQIHLDYSGALTLSVSLVLLLVVVERGNETSVALNLVLILLCLACGWLFIRIERKSPEPLIPLDLFRTRMVTLTTIHGFFTGMVLLGTMNFLPLFVQAVIGTDAVAAGKILMPFILPWVLTATLGGRLLLSFGYRPIVLTGMILLTIGAILLVQVSPQTTRYSLSLAAAFLGMGGGLTMASLMVAAQHAVPNTKLGVTTSLVQFARSIGAAIGTGVMGALINWRLSRTLAATGPELSQLSGRDLGSVVLPSMRETLSPAAATFLKGALAGSLRTAFFFVLIAVFLAFVTSFFIPGGRASELAHDPSRAHSAPTEL